MINNRPLIDFVMTNGSFTSHEQMACEIGINRSLINLYYANKRRVSATFLIAIMRYLGIPISVIDEYLGMGDIGVGRKNPNRLLDEIMKRYGMKSDLAIATKLKMTSSAIWRLRNEKGKAGSKLILTIHEVFGMPTSEIRQLLGENNETTQ